jgi:hypothetical protein
MARGGRKKRDERSPEDRAAAAARKAAASSSARVSTALRTLAGLTVARVATGVISGGTMLALSGDEWAPIWWLRASAVAQCVVAVGMAWALLAWARAETERPSAKTVWAAAVLALVAGGMEIVFAHFDSRRLGLGAGWDHLRATRTIVSSVTLLAWSSSAFGALALASRSLAGAAASLGSIARAGAPGAASVCSWPAYRSRCRSSSRSRSRRSPWL